jgi:hypothetical protein
VAIQCPLCSHAMAVKGAKAGRYSPTCSNCKTKFLLIVPADPAQSPTAQPLSASAPPIGVKPAPSFIDQTLAPAAASVSASSVHAVVDQAAPVKSNPPPFAPPPSAISATSVPGASPDRPAPSAYSAAMAGKLDSAPADEELTGSLGGYVLKHKLGQGGMGSVYKARQISLDRDVAVKVINQRWSSDAQFIARFTGEAYATAHLTHHNVVQIYDIGIERGRHFFSMEFVPGKNLAAVVKEAGHLDPEVAVGYALQAARGLRFAHDQGTIHRDVKPENLLLNDQGIVKVADLGLVKTAAAAGITAHIQKQLGTEEIPASPMQTQLNISMGTPAYMAPEQAQDAARVDARADIYSLGCSLYDMVTGRPPFTGNTPVEVISKHIAEPITPPEMLVQRIPKSLSAIITRMIAKRPGDRFSNMAGVIRAMEEFLGVSSAGPFTPKEEHAATLERAVATFNTVPAIALRRLIIRLFWVIGIPLVILCGLFRWITAAGAILGLIILTVVAYQVIVGVTMRTYLFRKVRQAAFGNRWFDWLKWLAVAAAAAFILWLFGWLWVWCAIALAAVADALIFHLAIDLAARRQRKPAVAEVETMLKSMRLRGLEETALRQFVCKYSGDRWEEFYETLFGYEAKLTAREQWGRGDNGRRRRKFAAWRDPVIAACETRIRARQEAIDRKVLEDLETASYESTGESGGDARQKARAAANNVMARVMQVQSVAARRAASTVGPAVVTPCPAPIFAAPDESRPNSESPAIVRDRTFGGYPGWLIFGPHVRFVVGAALTALFLLWLHQNDLLRGDKFAAWAQSHALQSVGGAPSKITTHSLAIFLLPTTIADKLFYGIAPGLAGLLLLLSSIIRGAKMGVFLLPAAFLIVAAPLLPIAFLGIPAAIIGFLGGTALAALGFWFGYE